MVNIAFLVPGNNLVLVDFFKCFFRAVLDLKELGHGVGLCMTNDTYVGEARLNLAKYVKEQVAVNKVAIDYVVWLDSDHCGFDATTIVDLCNNFENLLTFDLLSALYFTRRRLPPLYNFPVCLRRNNLNGDGKYYFVETYTSGVVIECDAVGFGFTVMRPAFLLKMLDSFGDRLFSPIDDPVTGRYIWGEDVAFCERAKSKFHSRIGMDSRVKVDHGFFVVNEYLNDGLKELQKLSVSRLE